MFFDDWMEHKEEVVSKTILWEYDTTSEDWSWENMAPTVVARVLEYGRTEDYYAMFQLYGGKKRLREIARRIPFLPPKELKWCCTLFGLRKEELLCWKRQQSRKALFSS